MLGVEFIATITAAIFAGAALYVKLVEHPARRMLDTKSAALQLAPSYRRATWMQAPLALSRREHGAQRACHHEGKLSLRRCLVPDQGSHTQRQVLPLRELPKILRYGVCRLGIGRATHLTIASPQASVTRYDSGGGFRAFCTVCGSPLWFEPAGLPQYRGIPLGAVDDRDVSRPRMHVWTKSKVSWASIHDDLPIYETHP